jgi:hypothetical protein
MRYAVAHPKGIFASGRAEPTILFGKKVAWSATFFPKRSKKYHAAAGEAGFHLVKRPV